MPRSFQHCFLALLWGLLIAAPAQAACIAGKGAVDLTLWSCLSVSRAAAEHPQELAEETWEQRSSGVSSRTGTTWLRAPLEALPGAQLHVMVEDTQLDRVDVWLDGSPVGSAGDQVPVAERDTPYRNPTVSFTMPPSGSGVLTLRVQASRPTWVLPRVLDNASLVHQVSRTDVQDAFLRGALACLMTLLVVIAVLSRQRDFGTFAGTVMLVGVYHWTSRGYLAALLVVPPFLDRSLSVVLGSLMLLLCARMSRHLLRDGRAGRPRGWEEHAERVLVVLSVLPLLLPDEWSGVPARIAVTGITASVIVSTLDGQRHPLNRSNEVLLAWAPMVVPAVALWLRAPLDLGRFPEESLKLAFTWQLVVVSVLLAQRFAVARKAEEAARGRMISEAQQRLQAEQALERRELELRRARRTASLGRLAGGVAHDFNNLLTVILGSAEEARDAEDRLEVLERVDDILDAGERAAKLVRQLLTYSRRQPMERVPMDVHTSIEELATLMRRVLGERIQLEVELSSERSMVLGDPSQLEQVLVNLVVNARDAMPEGGVLRITSELADPSIVSWHDSPPDVPVLGITIRDSGIGIPLELQERIFEPFFTTKAPNEGTGLGLATAWSIVQRMGGTIRLASQPGQGTAFTIWLPVTDRQDWVTQSESLDTQPLRGQRTLLAEDESKVRQVLARALMSAGLDVVTATDGDVAIEKLEHGPPVDVLVTDMIMPGSLGDAVVRKAREINPRTAVVIVSGYSDELRGGVAQFGPGVKLVNKPCRAAELVKAIDQALEESQRLALS